MILKANTYRQTAPTLKPTLPVDKWLLISVFSIIAIGVLMVTSASMVISERQYGTPFYYARHQIIYLILGVLTAAAVVRIPVKLWEKWSPWLLFVGLVLLIMVLLPGLGRSVNGSRRWLNLLVMNVQVSEIVKLFVILFLSGYIVRRESEIRNHVSGFLKPMGLLAIMSVFLLLEPDFGATVVIMATALTLLFMAGVKLRHFLVLLLIVFLAMGALAIASPYRMARLTAFINPWARQFDTGYQLTQSLIAFGRGGWFGVGLGDSIQKLFYLPEAHTDFLFAVLAEELGFIGEMVVIGLFGLLISRIFIIARRVHHDNQVFSAFACYGFAFWIAFQVIVNIGVCAGILPTKGLTLPFMSYGGSSLLIMSVVIAIILRIDYEHRMSYR